jgi:tetratricopeptide (TPR) repeat protein
MLIRTFFLLIACALVFANSTMAAEGNASTDEAMAAAMALVKAKRYPEAREALEKIVVANPTNAAACHELGLLLKRRNDSEAFEQALKWLAKAAELEPNNPRYLGDFGGTSLQFASRSNSFSAATKGRDAMEKAIAIDPNYLDAREGLFHFYQRAPWPLGSSAKATRQLEEIGKRDPDLATVLGVVSKTNAKDYGSAFRMCDEVLAKKAANYVALYHYGRTAAISGQNVERGLECLKQCLTIDPPTPASPSQSAVWQRIGNLHEKCQRIAEARAAYETALKLEPTNSQAAEALAKLK